MKRLIIIKELKFYFWVGIIWLLFWILVAFTNHESTFIQQVINEIWRFFYIVFANLIFFEYFLPLILKKRSGLLFNILIAILVTVLQLFIITIGLYGWKNLGIQLNIYTSFRQVTLIPDGYYHRAMEDIYYQAQGGIASIFFFGLTKLFYANFKLKQTTQLLRLEKQEAELNYLKSQTNPHFLFNTLNNIYSLAKDKSDLAAESILRLSKILRFMLYETSGKFISIEKELEIISDYIDLEKLRYDDSLRVKFTRDIKDMKQTLPPLLLIPLVENAFKHGVSETSHHPFVDIYLKADCQQILFVVKNSVENIQRESNVTENIGLSNLRRQLELLYTDYNLSVQQNETVFTAILKINITSHV